MQTFNTLYNRCLDLGLRTRSPSTSPTNFTTLFKGLVNDSHQIITEMDDWNFLEDTADLTSVADQEGYELPIQARHSKVTAVRFEESASVIYTPKPVYSWRYWEYLQSLGTASSDVTQFFYIQDEKVLLYPKPSTASKTIRVRFKKGHRDFTQDDYSTGTILTTTNGNTGVVGTGTPNWAGGLSPEATLHLRITKTASDSAKSGDGRWYEVSSITDDTNLVLVKNYGGTSIATGTAAYIIGEMPLLPGDGHDLMVWRPLAIYFMSNGEDQVRADRFWMMYDGGFESGRSQSMGGLLKRFWNNHAGTTEGMFIEEQQPREFDLSDLSVPRRDFTGEGW